MYIYIYIVDKCTIITKSTDLGYKSMCRARASEGCFDIAGKLSVYGGQEY